MSGRIRAVFWPRFSVSQPKQKLSQRIARAFDLDENTLRGIQDPAAQLQFSGQAIHERPKTHSLHCAAHDHSSSFMGRRSHPVNLSHAVRAAGLSWIEPYPAVRLGRRGRKAAISRLKGNEHAALNCERGLRRNTDSVAEFGT